MLPDALQYAFLECGNFALFVLKQRSHIQIPESWKWIECNLDEVVVGAVGTAALVVVAGIFGLTNGRKEARAAN